MCHVNTSPKQARVATERSVPAGSGRAPAQRQVTCRCARRAFAEADRIWCRN